MPLRFDFMGIEGQPKMFGSLKSKGTGMGRAELSAMLENMPIGVMTCDLKDFRINYVNPQTIESLKLIEDALPCRAEDIVGQCIDIFHKNPAHQRTLLSNPKNLPHRTKLEVGDEILDLLVSPIYSGGKYIGPMVTWSIVTQQVHAEEEAARLKRMLDEMPINVMLLDKEDFTITYVNKTSIETLRPLQSLLPCPVDKIQGQCVDIFHKNPAHQRAILSDPTKLPYDAKIKVGDETLDLRVSAVRDSKGNYMGPMLNWTLATARVKLADDFESNIGSSVAALLESAQSMQANSTSLAASSEESNVQAATVSAATEELSSSINEISRQVATSNEIAGNAVTAAEESNVLITEMSEAARKISEVVNIIQDIADQTNLLALNATIEAARAGEAGKGFAVVASEVKELASQTSKATEDITKNIGQIQGATDTSVESMQTIQRIIGEVAEISSGIAAAVEEQSAATQQVAQNIVGVSDASKEVGEMSTQFQTSAGALSEEADNLKENVESFLVQVRAM